jgi:hypothetical protein
MRKELVNQLMRSSGKRNTDRFDGRTLFNRSHLSKPSATQRERCRTTSLSEELDALGLLVTACEAVFLTALKCRIAARILNFEPSQPQLS